MQVGLYYKCAGGVLQVASNSGWEAFGEHAPAPAAAVPASPSPTKPAAAPQQVAAAAPQPMKKEERREVPLDIFFPEFEQIRATGLLPNGQLAPMPARPQQFGGYGGMPAAQVRGCAGLFVALCCGGNDMLHRCGLMKKRASY
jgi:hypothetical protein